MESDHDLISLFEHDLFGKPVSTFPDHALGTSNPSLFWAFWPCSRRPRSVNNIRLTPATVWRIAAPYFRSDDKFAGLLLLASVVAIELTVVAINVLLNQWNNRFFTALQERNWDS